jgi:exodeoxyribonuclease VII small subunit
MEKDASYNDKLARIRAIAAEIKRETQDVDVLMEQLNEGLQLVKECTKQLRAINDKMQEAFDKMQ